jgi:uncharacterized protein YggE
MRKALLSWLTAACLVIGMAALPVAAAEWAGERAAREGARTVASSGEATVYVTPDEVVLNVGVETFHAELDQASSLNDEASKRLVAAVKGMGVEEKHIQTADLQIEIRYKAYDKPNLGVEGYIARRAYSLTLKKIKEFENLVAVCLKNGANRLQGFEYRTTELRKHRDEARKMAVKAAKEKAELLAGELGCKVAAPRTINEGSVGYYGYWQRSWGNAYMSQNAVQHVGGGEGGGETMPLGQVAIRASVNVTFDMTAPPAAVAERE